MITTDTSRLKNLCILLITILNVSYAYAQESSLGGLSYEELVSSNHIKLYDCSLTINNSELTKAGTFFGSGKVFDYQLALSVANPPGPLLLVKLRQTDKLLQNPAKIYLVSKITSSCEDMQIDFLEVSHTKNGFILTKPHHKISLKLNIFSSKPEEGEFKQVDLNAKIYFDNEFNPSEQLTLIRASRYQFPAILANTNCADKLNEMSAELCGLFAIEMNPETLKQCSLGMSGKLDSEIVRWKAYESAEKDELKLNKSRNEWLKRKACPNATK